MKIIYGVRIICLFVLLMTATSQTASAGFLDKIKNATQKLNTMTGEIKNTDQKVQQHSGKNCGALGAGCLDYMDTETSCEAPLQGARSQAFADVIGERLKSGKDISATQRTSLEEDRRAFLIAAHNKTNAVDQKISNRLFEDMPHDDQVEANRRYGVTYNQIMSKCSGADHMGVGHTTQMNYLK